MGKAWSLVVFFLWLGACGRPLPSVHEGDIIFHTSNSNQSLAIQRATHSPYSHMGIVFFRDGKPFVMEAAATVRYTPLEKWIRRGQGGHFVLKRLKDADTQLSPAVIQKLHEVARQLEGRPYDLTFEWSDDRIYCSELVWKIYKRGAGIEIGSLQAVKDFDLEDPVVAAKMRERFGDKIPLIEPVISPAAMFESSLLKTVEEY